MTQSPAYTPAPPADFILSFDLANVGVRGRLVRLDAVSARALCAHALPEAATRTLGETLALSALLGSALKLDGRLTVQTQSDGPLDLVAADYYGAEASDADAGTAGRPAGLRGYARLDAARFEALGEAAPGFARAAGSGALAITIEPRRGGNTYQGIVALAPEGVAESAQTYFAQSEQLPTMIRLAAVPVVEPAKGKGMETHWRAAGLMLQSIPEKPPGEDDWRRLGFILDTLEDIELIDTGLTAEDLLWRLFNEDEIRVHPSERVQFRCDCRTERIASVLRAYRPDEREGLADADGVIRAKCEFCGKSHEVMPWDLETVR
jgi:molecular chaperone Hsp33